MEMSRRFSLFLFPCLFSSLVCAQQVENPSPTTKRAPAFAEKILVDGISNAGKLNDHLYRGSQPNERGLQKLKKLGVTTIVDLRGELEKKREWESRQAQALGMRFVVIPGNGWSPPTDEQIAQFFALLAERPVQTIFIHCWFGTDRTGVFIAAYRLAFQHWTPEQAIAEMYDFHFKGFWHPAMKKYVKTFPARLATSPALASYRAIEHSTPTPVSSLPSSTPGTFVPCERDSCFIPDSAPQPYPYS